MVYLPPIALSLSCTVSSELAQHPQCCETYPNPLPTCPQHSIVARPQAMSGRLSVLDKLGLLKLLPNSGVPFAGNLSNCTIFYNFLLCGQSLINSAHHCNLISWRIFLCLRPQILVVGLLWAHCHYLGGSLLHGNYLQLQIMSLRSILESILASTTLSFLAFRLNLDFLKSI